MDEIFYRIATNSNKISKFVRIFSLESFRYTVCDFPLDHTTSDWKLGGAWGFVLTCYISSCMHNGICTQCTPLKHITVGHILSWEHRHTPRCSKPYQSTTRQYTSQQQHPTHDNTCTKQYKFKTLWRTNGKPLATMAAKYQEGLRV